MNELIDALERAGATVRGKSVRCPFHDDKHPSGVIYQGRDGVWRYRCYVCNWNQGRNWGHVGDVLKVSGQASIGQPPTGAVAHPLPQHTTVIDWAQFMEQYGMGAGEALVPLSEYLDLHIELLNSFGVQRGWADNVYLVPMYNENDQQCGVQYRCLDGTKRCATGSRAGLFLRHDVHMTYAHKGVLCITEGVTDAAVAVDCGYGAIGCFSASSSLDPLETFLYRRAPMRLVIFADGDDAGNTFATRVKKQVGRHSLSTTIIRHPPGQDLRSWRPSRAALEAVIHAGE